ncbi:MAG: hypothetical protein VB120_01640 [Lachnospiraceae bacterium]|nr:hypothetical protein [Lachnospiraceae bacterium]
MNVSNAEAGRKEIRLTLPINKAYIHIACMTADAIAKKLKLNTEKSEEIKMAVSEAYSFIVDNEKIFDEKSFQLQFIHHNDSLKIYFDIETKNPNFNISSLKYIPSENYFPFEMSVYNNGSLSLSSNIIT